MINSYCTSFVLSCFFSYPGFSSVTLLKKGCSSKSESRFKARSYPFRQPQKETTATARTELPAKTWTPKIALDIAWTSRHATAASVRVDGLLLA